MDCLFCERSSIDSKSVEHIIPESLGNTVYILPVGVVCDKCNNYFSREIEGPLLSHNFFRQKRHCLGILSKKGRIPDEKGFIIDPVDAEVAFSKDKNGKSSVS